MQFTVSGTATNGGKARTLIQRRDLSGFGFACGDRYRIKWEADAIVLTADPEGERKVSRVTDKRRGHEYQTIDLRYPESDRQDLFNGADRLAVEVGIDSIVITAAQ